MTTRRKMWESPWGYPESIAVTAGITATGLLLQFAVGSFDYSLLALPVNVVLGGVMVVLLGVSLRWRNTGFYRWFSGPQITCTLLGALAVATIAMGLIPQHPSLAGGHSGWNNITASWPFVLLYTTLLVSLGMLTARRLRQFRVRDYAFYLNHIGLWLLLFAAAAGHSDTKRYLMYVNEGETQWRVYNSENRPLELPVAIRLHDFAMETYPAKLAVIDRRTGAIQPADAPVYFQIDTLDTRGTIAGWDIELLDYFHHAVRTSNNTYRAAAMPGTTPAARIRVTDRETGTATEGWVSGGNAVQSFSVLELNDTYCVAMTRPDPKRFASQVTVFTQSGKTKTATIEVNTPCRIDSWTIYQYGYDESAGELSRYSCFELVYDPWMPLVYLGILLSALGSICLIVKGGKQ